MIKISLKCQVYKKSWLFYALFYNIKLNIAMMKKSVLSSRIRVDKIDLNSDKMLD